MDLLALSLPNEPLELLIWLVIFIVVVWLVVSVLRMVFRS
jgi:hypothetical protein